MKPLAIIIPVLFFVTFTIMLGGLPLYVDGGQAFYKWIISSTTAGADSDTADKFLERAASGASRFDSFMSNQPRAKIANGPLSSIIPKDQIGLKPVILVFDDGARSQYQFIRPILDHFDFRATFFVTCNLLQSEQSDNPFYMTWSQVGELQRAGHDIQSHSMNHRSLIALSQEELEYEVGSSKTCLQEHGIYSDVFATPYNDAWNNSTVIDAIGRHYSIAKNGISTDAPMHLHCNGWDGSVTNQTDCNTYDAFGKLNYANRYSIKTWSHNYFDLQYANNHTAILSAFAESVNRAQTFYPGSDAAKSVVIVEYHGLADIDNDMNKNLYFDTDPYVFYAEMKYLHDNGFAVFTMSDLSYDRDGNILLLDPVGSISQSNPISG